MITRMLTFLLLTISMYAAAQVTRVEPQPSTHRQDSLISVATGLHDDGNYDDAIAMYRRVLEENSSNVTALYEISYSCYAKGAYDDAIRYAEEGVRYESTLLPTFYLNIGNALDLQGKTEKAIEAFRTGILLGPNKHLLEYNLGLAFSRQGKLDSARTHLQSAMLIKPSHPSSHLALAEVYNKMKKGVPRVLALARFLVLEPNSRRSKEALDQLLVELGRAPTGASPDPGRIEITITPDSDSVDGDLTVLELALATTAASRYTEEERNKPDLEWRVHEISTFFQIMLEVQEQRTSAGFFWKYYVPYFTEMQRKGFTEAFVYMISVPSGSEEVSAWMKTNKKKVAALVAWSNAYGWDR